MTDLNILIDLSLNLIKSNHDNIKSFRQDMKYFFDKMDDRLSRQEKEFDFLKEQILKLTQKEPA